MYPGTFEGNLLLKRQEANRPDGLAAAEDRGQGGYEEGPGHLAGRIAQRSKIA